MHLRYYFPSIQYSSFLPKIYNLKDLKHKNILNTGIQVFTTFLELTNVLKLLMLTSHTIFYSGTYLQSKAEFTSNQMKVLYNTDTVIQYLTITKSTELQYKS